jgi:ABC-type transport system involved in multi-copper enzyme maturation permease subunit
MESAQQAMEERTIPPAQRASSIHMGRQNYFSVVLRLVSMELYKLRRRSMSRVLIVISVIAAIGMFALVAVYASLFVRSGNSLPPGAFQSISEPLRLPMSLYLIQQLLTTLGQVLIVILVSTIIGGEYSSGTIRLMFTRGPTRTQILLSKVGTALVCIILGVIGITILGVLSGLLFNLTTGIALSFALFSLAWLGNTLLFCLIIALGLFVYAMMGLLISTLGKTSAAGIASVLIWSFVIEPLVNVVGAFAGGIGGPMGSFLRVLPDYMIGRNISALLTNLAPSIFGGLSGLLYGASAGSLSVLHSLLVLAAYLVAFIGLAWWIVIRRDVTN